MPNLRSGQRLLARKTPRQFEGAIRRRSDEPQAFTSHKTWRNRRSGHGHMDRRA